MQYLDFVIAIEDLKPKIRGLGKVIAARAELSMSEYYNVTAGKIKDADVLGRVYDATKQVIRERVEYLSQEM